MPHRRPKPARAQDASRRAFEEEALALIDRLYSAALRLTRDESDANDLVQETYLRAFRAADRFEPGTNLRAWMFTILHNAHLNQRRDRGRSPIDTDSDAVEQAQADHGRSMSPDEMLARSTLDRDLQAALDALPEQFREAVWLRDVEEFSYGEIAGVMQVPIGTVMSRISRGRRLLHDALVARTNRFDPKRSPAGANPRVEAS